MARVAIDIAHGVSNLWLARVGGVISTRSHEVCNRTTLATEALLTTLVREFGVSREELARVEKFLLKELLETGAPMAPRDLIERGRKAPERFSASLVRRAIWHLVSTGILYFTSDWSVATKAPA